MAATQARELKSLRDAVTGAQKELRTEVAAQLTTLSTTSDARLKDVRTTVAASLKDLREEQAATLQRLDASQAEKLRTVTTTLTGAQKTLTDSVSTRLETMAKSNEARLEAMRVTVQEKLDDTLTKRLDSSFTRVSERLDLVGKGLHDMQALAQGVGSLQRTLTNVKHRGAWAELPLAPPTSSTGAGRDLGALASEMTGDAHGLDDGRPLAAVVLRGVAAARGVAPPESPADRRALWAAVGVSTDAVSGTVMTWALRPPDVDAWSASLRARADLGLVTHLTVQELRSPAASGAALVRPGAVVSVCENPQVLQAAARAGVVGPLVCTSGNPSAAGWLLLDRLVEDGGDVRYHGDLDWPGVSIAARVLARGARPWRLAAVDYESAVAASGGTGLPLAGPPVPTPWDDGLSAAMRRRAVAVHEEAVLTTLLADL